MKIELAYPIPIKDKEGNTQSISEITLPERLKVKHLESLPNDLVNVKPSEFAKVISGIANIPIESAKEIDMEDLEVIFKGMEKAFPKKGQSRTTGKK